MKSILSFVLTVVLLFSLSGCNNQQSEDEKVKDLSLSESVFTTEKEKEFDTSSLDFELVTSSLEKPASLGEWSLTEISDSLVCFRIADVNTDSNTVSAALKTLNEGYAEIYNLSAYDLGDDLEFAVATYEIYIPEDYLYDSVSSPKLNLLPADGGAVMKYDGRETVLYGDMMFPMERTVSCEPGETVVMHSLFIRQKSSVNYVISNSTVRNTDADEGKYLFWYTEV